MSFHIHLLVADWHMVMRCHAQVEQQCLQCALEAGHELADLGQINGFTTFSQPFFQIKFYVKSWCMTLIKAELKIKAYLRHLCGGL